MRIVVLTEGDPARMSGGFLYHRRLADQADDHGAAVRFVSVPQRPFPLAVVDGPRVMRSAVANADVLVVDSLASNTMGPWIALGLGRRVPIVGSLHQPLGGMDGGRLRRVVQSRFDAMAWARSARLIVASELLADQLVADGLPHDEMTVVPPGRDVIGNGGWRPSTAELRRGREAALLCVANWLPHKGIVELLDAFTELPTTLATLHLVGDESVAPAYRRRVLARLGRPVLDGRVVRHGVVAPESMGGLYAAADVFVLASTIESYGTVYGEAMATGLPVVGWAEGNLPNLADDEVEGRLVPTGDVGALTEALAELAGDETLRVRLGQAAAARAEKLPTWAETAERFFAVCRAASAGARWPA